MNHKDTKGTMITKMSGLLGDLRVLRAFVANALVIFIVVFSAFRASVVQKSIDALSFTNRDCNTEVGTSQLPLGMKAAL